MLAAVGNITRLFGCSLLSLHSSYPHWSSGPVNSAVPGILDLIPSYIKGEIPELNGWEKDWFV